MVPWAIAAAFAPIAPAAALAAAAADTGSSPSLPDPIQTFGVAGFVVVLLLVFMRLLWSEIKALQAENRRLTDGTQAQVIAVTQANGQIIGAVEALREARADLGTFAALLDELGGYVHDLVPAAPRAARPARPRPRKATTT